MDSILRLVLFLFSPILAGAALRKLGVLRSVFELLRVFTTWIILPLIAFVYVGSLLPTQVATLWGAVMAAVMGVAACFFASCFFVSRLPKEEGVALVLNSSFTNVAHLGLPVIYAKLGSDFMPPAVLYAVTVAVLNLFLGTLLMHFLITRSPSLRQIFTQTFTFPAVVLLVLALLLVYLHAPLPRDFSDFFTQRVFPVFFLLLLVQVGYHLRIEISRKYARHLPVVAVLRFILCPLVTLAICRLMELGASVVSSSFYLSMMPPAFFNLILAHSLNLDLRPYSLTVFVLTLLSFPLLFLL
jgi:predicted permease